MITSIIALNKQLQHESIEWKRQEYMNLTCVEVLATHDSNVKPHTIEFQIETKLLNRLQERILIDGRRLRKQLNKLLSRVLDIGIFKYVYASLHLIITVI